jgi:hypothetical protein
MLYKAIACASLTTVLAVRAAAVDLTVTSVEVTQAIQTATHTVPLVSNRSTAVRATIGVADSAAPVGSVTGRLHVSVNGTEITPAAGVAPINAPFTAPLAPQRANEADTLNFELPAPTGITASSNVDVRVDITPVAGETNTANNSGAVNDLTFADRVTPLIYYTRVDFTPSGLGLPATALVQPGVGDAFVRGILPVDDSDPVLYREGLFPSLTFSADGNGNGMLEGCTDGQPESDELFSLLGSCRQLIVDSGVGASDRVFLFGFVAGNPIPCNGCAPLNGRVAYGNTQDIRYQRTFAHELMHNFGYSHNSDFLDEVGWDYDSRLDANPAGNNTTGRVKPTTRRDIMVAGLLTAAAWIKTGLAADGYVGLFNHPTLVPAAPDFAERVLVIQGIFDPSGRELLQLKPVFRYPWRSRPTEQRPPRDAPFAARIVDSQGNVTIAEFAARIGDDAENGAEGFGFFEVMVALDPTLEADSLSIVNTDTAQPFRTIRRSPQPPELQISIPKPGDTVREIGRVAWTVEDPDTPRADLLFQVAYSFDGGASFVPVAVDQRETDLAFDPTQIPPSAGAGLVRVIVSDGLNTAFADVGNLTVVGACVGDCDGDGEVTIDDLLRLVNIALGTTAIDGCAVGDPNRDGRIAISELVTAVRNALRGCP